MSLVINKKIENVYFDMDGVLVDFVGRFLDHYPEIGTQANMYKLDDEEFWPKVKAIEGFWENLDAIKGSLDLFKYAYNNFNVEILSSPSRHDKRSGSGKFHWLEKNLGDYVFSINLVRAQNKKYFANENSLLIDDLQSNIDGFRENGGTAIKFENAEQALNELKNI